LSCCLLYWQSAWLMLAPAAERSPNDLDLREAGDTRLNDSHFHTGQPLYVFAR
jgi:hypothetical protein